jgi:hypothetical protein
MKTIKSESKKTAATKPAAVKKPAKAAKPGTIVAAAPAPAGTTMAAASTPHREITCESIATCAYLLWEQQGRPHGRDFELWLQAEKQLKQAALSIAA